MHAANIERDSETPWAFAISGSLFCKMAEHSSLSITVERSPSLFLLLRRSFMNFAYLGIFDSASMKGMLTLSYFNIAMNLKNSVSSLSLCSRVGKGSWGRCSLIVVVAWEQRASFSTLTSTSSAGSAEAGSGLSSLVSEGTADVDLPLLVVMAFSCWCGSRG
ncbi:unnamed protein product [Linum trigynum]|uniref:Uncharacterized protein n=1 Tax=Linum trigynum TaxID=586398 RepID=A0AAV2GCA9_9ROSI